MRTFKILVLSAVSIACAAQISRAGEWPRAIAPSQNEKPRLVACPEFGPNYFRVGNSTTCLKVSGYVEADVLYHGGGGAGFNNANRQHQR